MDRNMILGILAAVTLLIGIGMLIPSGDTNRKVRALPWEAEVLEDGALRVFNLTLGRSTLADAERVLEDEADLQLFRMEDGALRLEGYFNQVWLSGLRAQMVVNLEGERALLESIYQRGTRISKAASGSSQVKLAAEDGLLAQGLPVNAITYIPKAKLEEELLVGYFGQPQRRRVEGEGERAVLHLLYPRRGIDVGIDPEGRTVIQYLPPDQFERVSSPLEEGASPSGGAAAAPSSPSPSPAAPSR